MANLPTVVILAGGENSRFFPLNQTTHKGALTLLGKPLIVRTLENLQLNGYTNIVIVVSGKDYDGKGLSGFLAQYEMKLDIQYVLQPEPKGMGDALLRAEQKLPKTFGIVFPTTLDAGDVLTELVTRAGSGGAMRVSYTQEPWLYGIVTIEDQKISSIIEKPKKGTEASNLKAHEMYYLTHEFIAFLKQEQNGEYNFEAALDKYFKVFDVTAVEQSNALPSLKYPWHLFEFQKMLLADQPQYVSPYASVAKTAVLDTTKGPIYIENGATVGHCSRIVGPAYIGKDVVIGDFSLVRESSFEEGSSVGVHSDVARSLIMERSSMHNGFLGDSIIGRDVQIGAGLITSNKRMDRKNIEVSVKDMKVDRGSDTLGTVVGDEARVGIRTNIMPGKFIGCRATVYPGTTVWESVPHDAVVKTKMDIEIKSA
jgi:UDP-N-acetylglucosamine diphosphorylase / glucose-1-phosphate thymidylyltransferase / UDP-N-acetylgalactosamine diphosphorylase / glucosamine-1-phosphate N-acetyltransferase / galactosamine-1-phosphate N-acetyltransferase